MPRIPRFLLPDGLFHVAARGVAKMPIYHDNNDRWNVLSLLALVVDRHEGMSGLLPDDEPLSPGARHDSRESLRRNADPQRRLRPGIQRQIWTLGTRLR